MLALEDRGFGRRRQADLGPQTMPGLTPRADGPLEKPEEPPVEGRAEEPEPRDEWGGGQRRWIVRGKEAEGGQHRGRPGNSLLLGHQSGDVGDRVGDQQVRALRRRLEVVIRFSQRRHDPLADHLLRAFTSVHEPPHQVGLGLPVGRVRANSPELDAQRLDLRPVAPTGRDNGLMTPCLQAKRDGKVGVQVAQRAEGRQDDSGLPACRRQRVHAVIPAPATVGEDREKRWRPVLAGTALFLVVPPRS